MLRHFTAIFLFLAIPFSLAFTPALESQTEGAKATSAIPDLTKEFDNVVKVEHLAPHIQAVLTDPEFCAFFQQISGGIFNLNELAFDLELQLGWAPKGVSIGFDDGLVTTLGQAWMIFCQMMVFSGALDDSGMPIPGVSPEEKSKLLGEMIQGLEGLPRGRLSVLIELDDGVDGESFVEELTDSAPLPPGLLRIEEGAVHADLGQFARAMGLPMMLGGLLGMWGANGEQVSALNQWGETVEGSVHVHGAGEWGRIDFSFGEVSPTAKPTAIMKEFAATLPAEESEITFRVDFTSLVAKVEQGQAMWEAWQDTELGRRAVATDTSGLFTDLQFISENLSQHGFPLVGSIDLGPKTKFHLRQKIATPPGADLSGSSLASSVPKDAACWYLDGRASLATATFTSVLDAEGRLELRSLLDEPVADQLEQYYELFGPLRELIVAASEAMPPGYGYIVDTPSIHDLRVTIGEPGAENGVVAKGVPVPGIALLVRSDDFARDRARFERAVEMAFGAILGNEEGSDPITLLAPAELGLGVYTLSLDLGPVLRRLEWTTQREVSGDFHPHVCAVGDLIVFSTRVELSRRIIAAAEDPASVVSAEGHVARAWNDPMPVLTSWFEELSNWFAKIEEGEASLVGIDSGDSEELFASMARMARGVTGQVHELMTRVRMAPVEETIRGGVGELRATMMIAPSKLKASITTDPPQLQKKRATYRALEYLVRVQSEDGRFSDGGASGLSDLALTSLAVHAFGDNFMLTVTNSKMREANTRALDWIIRQQAKEGAAAGIFGDPDSKSLWLDQALALRAISPRFTGVEDDHVEPVRLAMKQLERVPGQPMSLEEALWWNVAESNLYMVGGRLEDSESESLEELVYAISRAADAVIEDMPAEEKKGAIPFLLEYDFMEVDEAALAEICDEFRATDFASNRSSIEPLELFALSKVSENQDLDWSVSWISTLAIEQRRGSSDAGSWAPLAKPYGSDLAATAIILGILEGLQFEPTPFSPLGR